MISINESQVVDPRKGKEQALEETNSKKKSGTGFSKLVTTSGGRPGGLKTNYVSR
jgi:hypothetical protein